MTENLKDIKCIMLEEFENQLNDTFENFLKNDFSEQECLNELKTIIAMWNHKRIDIRNMGKKVNSVRVLEYDEKIELTIPNWYSDNKGQGICFKFKNEKCNNKGLLKLECISDGSLKILLRGPYYVSLNGKILRIYNNFTKLILNNKSMINDNKLCCHDFYHVINQKSFNGEIVTICYEIHSLYDYFPMLKEYIETILQCNINFRLMFHLIKNFIKRQKIQIQRN